MWELYNLVTKLLLIKYVSVYSLCGLNGKIYKLVAENDDISANN